MQKVDGLIGVFEKNASEQVRVAIMEFRGEIYLDVRVFSKFGMDNGYGPTKKGIRIKLDQAPILRALIGKAEKFIAFVSRDD